MLQQQVADQAQHVLYFQGWCTLPAVAPGVWSSNASGDAHRSLGQERSANSVDKSAAINAELATI
eukprot:9747197-Karenia_brevis.AAC.1